MMTGYQLLFNMLVVATAGYFFLRVHGIADGYDLAPM